MMALNIAACAMPFIGVGEVGKKIYNLFIEVTTFAVVRNTLDKVKRVELYCRFLGGIFFLRPSYTHIAKNTL